MMRLGYLLGAGLLVLAASAAQAKDDKPCPSGAICASRPETVVAALQAAGYKAQLGKDNTGDPSVTSAAAGYDFDILFYGCENHVNCDSLQFRLTFSPYENHSADLANVWNREKRLLKAEARPDKRLVFNYDVSTVGGLNGANFTDVVEWWALMMGEVDKFFRDHPPGKAIPSTPGTTT